MGHPVKIWWGNVQWIDNLLYIDTDRKEWHKNVHNLQKIIEMYLIEKMYLL